LEKKTFFFALTTQHLHESSGFPMRGRGGRSPGTAPVECQNQISDTAIISFHCLSREDFSESEVARLSFNKKDFMGGFGFGAVYMKSFFSQGRTCEIKYCVAMHRCLAKGA
jgi:hypothetical protein